MYGYQRMGVTIGVNTKVPYRKKPCLVVVKGNCGTKYASFNNMESAQEFLDILADFIGASRYDWNDYEEFRDATKEEKESVNKYIESISEDTGEMF